MHGLAHITGDGLRNLLRLQAPAGYEVSDPLPVPPVFELIARLGAVEDGELHDVFNMGCGFVAVVPADHAEQAAALLARRHPGTRPIGAVTGEAGTVTVPPRGLRFAS